MTVEPAIDETIQRIAYRLAFQYPVPPKKIHSLLVRFWQQEDVIKTLKQEINNKGK